VGAMFSAVFRRELACGWQKPPGIRHVWGRPTRKPRWTWQNSDQSTSAVIFFNLMIWTEKANVA
jgi:hypothetical protein